MEYPTFAGRVWLLSLLTLSSVILTTCTVTQYPAVACEGDRVIVSCDLTVPNMDDVFLSVITGFSVGSSNAVSETSVNEDTMIGGVDLSKLTAVAPIGTNKNVQGNITLLSYTTADIDTRLGCSIEYSIGGTSNRDFVIETLNLIQAAPPSPPVSLTADFNSPTCSGAVQLAWTPGASDRDIEMYFLSLNGVLIASLGSVTSYNHQTTLQRDTEYTYSVVAMSCAGNSIQTAAASISVGNPPSSPLVSISQPSNNNRCSNTLISWSTPSSDRSITSYSVYRDDTLIYTAPNTTNQYTDNTQLSISTVYEYSVVAVSCAGTSTAGVNYTVIEGTSLVDDSLSISYNHTTNELFADWELNQTNQTNHVIVYYSLSLVYDYTQNNTIYLYDETKTFLRTSDVTDYTAALIRPTFPLMELVVLNITATLTITQQCNSTFTGGKELTNTTDSIFTGMPSDESLNHAAAIGGAVSGVVLIVVVVSSGGVVIAITVLVKKKDSKKSKPGSVELDEQTYSQVNRENKKSKKQPPPEVRKMEGNYVDIGHDFPKPDNLKRFEPVEETMYSSVHPPLTDPATETGTFHSP